MPKFLDTTGVSYHLTQLINNARERLILISPYLKMNARIKELLEDQDRMKIDIRVVYGKNELQPEENNWLRGLNSIRTSFCENLHAKCYVNESEAIITSMNLYEFSQVNNNEMGIHIDRSESPQLYDDIMKEVQRIIRVSEELKVSVERISPDAKSEVAPPPSSASSTASKAAKAEKAPPAKVVAPTETATSTAADSGFCIRCAAAVPLNPLEPYCKKCYRLWAKYKNPNYEDPHCHICNTTGKHTLSKPACLPCYRKHKSTLKWADA